MIFQNFQKNEHCNKTPELFKEFIIELHVFYPRLAIFTKAFSQQRSCSIFRSTITIDPWTNSINFFYLFLKKIRSKPLFFSFLSFTFTRKPIERFFILSHKCERKKIQPYSRFTTCAVAKLPSAFNEIKNRA